LVVVFGTTGDEPGSIPFWDLRVIGLFDTFIQIDLFSPPFFSCSAEFGSDGIRIDQLLSEARLKE
jgi:hypothetical protein